MSYKQLLILDSTDSTLSSSRYKFSLDNFRISKYKLKNYLINGIDMTTAKYLCCEDLALHTINRNVDGRGQPSDIIALITDDIEISTNFNTMHLNEEKVFRDLTLTFKDSNGALVEPSNFVVVIEVMKDAQGGN